VWDGHSLRQAQGRLCPSLLTLVVSAGESNLRTNTKIKIKGDGQECPSHSFRDRENSGLCCEQKGQDLDWIVSAPEMVQCVLSA